jgi:hypothetical protein
MEVTMPSTQETAGHKPALVQVYVTSGLLQAEIIKGKLESNGIPALLKYESMGLVLGITTDGLGQVQVMVPADKAEQAYALLHDTDDPGDETITE